MINFIKGIMIGIAMAAPVGPLALLCIRRSLTKGFRAGAATSFGIALADGFYALVAALGLSALSTFVLARREYLFIAGGVTLIALGVKALRNPPVFNENAHKIEQYTGPGIIATILQTMLITLTNPMTIVSFLAAFSALGLEGYQETTQAIYIALGVSIGSLIWFMLLSATVAHYRTRVTPTIYRFIHMISGSLLIVYGVVFLLDAAGGVIFKTYLSSHFF